MAYRELIELQLCTVVAVCIFAACGNPAGDFISEPGFEETPEVFDGVRVDEYPPFSFQPWFPLEGGARYLFEGRFEDTIYEESVTVVRHQTPFGILFFFAKEEEITDPSPLLSTNMFGLSGYLTTDSHVLTVQSTFFDGFEKERSAYIQTMLSLPPRIGDSIEIKRRGKPIRLTVVSREDVDVPAGHFEECVRIEIDDGDRSNEIVNTAWIAKNVGLIKWRRKTGRVDQLVMYEPPGKTETGLTTRSSGPSPAAGSVR